MVPDGAEIILKLRAIVVNGDLGDLGDYMNYYKTRYRNEKHLSRYAPDSITDLGLTALTETPRNGLPLKKTHPYLKAGQDHVYVICQSGLGIADTWTLTAPGPSGNEPAAGPGHDDVRAITSQPGHDPADGEQDAPGQQEDASGTPASADGHPGPGQAAQPDGDPADDEPADGDPAEGSPTGEDTAASHEQDETAPPAGGSAPAGAPPNPALVAQIAGHIKQIQAAASAAATALADGGDLHAARTGLDEICEQAAQARREVKAAASGTKAPAARPGGLREKVLAHLRANPGSSFTPHEIHKVNGHSSGAIANALDTLVKHGDAELATEKPRRFRLVGGAAAPAEAQAPAEPAVEDTGAGDKTDLAGAA